MDRSNSTLKYLKSKQPEKGGENNASVVVELALILMSVKKMGEMRVNLIFVAKMEVVNQVGTNLLEQVSLI